MRILYLECGAGVSGDMIMGALADLMSDDFDINGMISSIGIPDVSVTLERGKKSCIASIRARVAVNGKEEGAVFDHRSGHRSLEEVLGTIDSLNIPTRVKEHATAIYRDIADAESKVHGEPVGEIHFHEVGMMDAITDVVIDCMLIDSLAPERIVVSPIRTGYGTVRCAHGELPVPAPATALLLKGIPSYAGAEEGEFATPTGVAIVRHFADEFGQRPMMSIEDIGVGAGAKETEFPNILRAFIGQGRQSMPSVSILECNIDDMTPEDLGAAMDSLISEGVLDVTISPVLMKKGRPGHLLTCLCRHEDKDRLSKLILERTSTIGIRTWDADRYEMVSRSKAIETGYGQVRVKVSEGYGIRKWKIEHDDLRALSEKHGVSIDGIRKTIDLNLEDLDD